MGVKKSENTHKNKREKKGGRTNEGTDCLFSSRASAIKYEYKKRPETRSTLAATATRRRRRAGAGSRWSEKEKGLGKNNLRQRPIRQSRKPGISRSLSISALRTDHQMIKNSFSWPSSSKPLRVMSVFNPTRVPSLCARLYSVSRGGFRLLSPALSRKSGR